MSFATGKSLLFFMFHCWTNSVSPLAELPAKEKIFWQSLELLWEVEVRKELEGKQCLNYILLPVQQKKHCPGASRSTEVIWCLFSVFILFKITSPNFCLGNYQMGPQHGTCSVRLRLLSCLRLKSSRCLWKNCARHMLCLKCNPCLHQRSSTHLSEREGAADSRKS